MQLLSQLVIAVLGVYLVCGALWARYNRRKPLLYQIMAPDFLVVLLWPVSFYRSYLSMPERFWVHTDSPEEVSNYSNEHLAKAMKPFSSWSHALTYALQAAKEKGHSVIICDHARYEKVFSGRLRQRMYYVEPSGEVCISPMLRRRVIRKADSIPTSRTV